MADYPEVALKYRNSEYSAEYRDDARRLLLSLKNARRDMRHDGAHGAREWLDGFFWPTAQFLERFARQARDWD